MKLSLGNIGRENNVLPEGEISQSLRIIIIFPDSETRKTFFYPWPSQREY